MEHDNKGADGKGTIEEKRLVLDERRLALDSTFARKWLPTLATVMAGLIAGLFSYVQQQNSVQATERARIEATARAEREWGFKVVEMYFGKRELFDFTKNAEQAELNLRVLAAVAPKAVQGVLDAERRRIPPPTGDDDAHRLDSLAAVAGVEEALADAKQALPPAESEFTPAAFTVYVQYPEGDRGNAERARNMLTRLGYNVPGIERVEKAPSRLEVRYYRPEQRSHAAKLATDLGNALSVRGGPDNAIQVRSAKQLPEGILEVWLPRQPN